jgi:hypothetical protein
MDRRTLAGAFAWGLYLIMMASLFLFDRSMRLWVLSSGNVLMGLNILLVARPRGNAVHENKLTGIVSLVFGIAVLILHAASIVNPQ